MKVAKLAWSLKRTSTTLLAGHQANHTRRLEVGYHRIQVMATESETDAAMGILDGMGIVLRMKRDVFLIACEVKLRVENFPCSKQGRA